MQTLYKTAKAISLAAIIGTTATASMAATTTLDFTGETIGALAGDTFTTMQDGLTFTFSGLGLKFRTLPSAFETQYGLDVFLSTTSDGQPITMTIGGATINSLTYLNPIAGVASSEVDVITAEAFNGVGTSIDFASNGNEFNTLFGDIATVVFDDVSTGYVLGEFAIDFDEISAVPLPAGLPLLLAGLGSLAALRRKKNA